MMKNKRTIITLAALMIISLSVSLTFLISQQNKAIREHDSALQDRIAYTDKKFECYGSARTNNSIVNNAGLSSCGGELAIKSLHFLPLQNVVQMCGKGKIALGCVVFGTAYVCSPGSTYNYWINRYYYYQYVCNDYYNTIRHELLHLVYSELSGYEQQIVQAKLSDYKAQYASQLAEYSADQQDDELFVRVGADGRRVDDIELIDLYSQVSSTYTAQKYDYYVSLASTSDKYVKKYNELSNSYSALLATVIILIIINACFLVYLFTTLKKIDTKSNRNRRESAIDEAQSEYVKTIGHKTSSSYYDADGAELDSLKRQIDEMGCEPKKDTKKEFEEFKKKYGIIDIDDE